MYCCPTCGKRISKKELDEILGVDDKRRVGKVSRISNRREDKRIKGMLADLRKQEELVEKTDKRIKSQKTKIIRTLKDLAKQIEGLI